MKLGFFIKTRFLNTHTQENKMFNTFTYAFIDAVSDSKKKLVEQTVQHDGIKNALNTFVDSQTKYTKAAADAGMQSMMSMGLIFSSKDFYNDLTDSFKSLIPAVITTKKAK